MMNTKTINETIIEKYFLFFKISLKVKIENNKKKQTG